MNTLGLMGTHWKHHKTENALHPNPTSPKTQKKKTKPRGFPDAFLRALRQCMLSLLVDCMEFLLSKLFVIIFNLSYYPHHKLGVLIMRWK
jgi:hypothetical protein